MEARGGGGSGRVVVLAFCIAGIWCSYITQGVLQETLSTKRFGPDKRRFEHLAFLNLAQNVVCFLWSLIMLMIWPRSSSGGAPWWSYWSASITNTIGPAMGIEALKYISYPAQVLAKSSKMIPGTQIQYDMDTALILAILMYLGVIVSCQIPVLHNTTQHNMNTLPVFVCVFFLGAMLLSSLFRLLA